MRRALLLAIALLATACATSATETVDVVAESGREAIAAAQGEPHILWFWGAN